MPERNIGDDHDILIEVKVKMDRMISDIEGLRIQQDNSASNLEVRVRALENFRWWILGISASLSFLGAIVGHFLTSR